MSVNILAISTYASKMVLKVLSVVEILTKNCRYRNLLYRNTLWNLVIDISSVLHIVKVSFSSDSHYCPV